MLECLVRALPHPDEMKGWMTARGREDAFATGAERPDAGICSRICRRAVSRTMLEHAPDGTRGRRNILLAPATSSRGLPVSDAWRTLDRCPGCGALASVRLSSLEKSVRSAHSILPLPRSKLGPKLGPRPV
jgi:hypothetical protein